MKPLTAASLGFLILSFAASACLAQAPATLDYDSTIKQGTAQLQTGSGDLALASGEAAKAAAPGRWEGHALLGRSLLSLKRYEPAADALSEAIKLAPQSEQPALRDLRRQCLLAEAGSVSTVTSAPVATAVPDQPSAAASRMSIETARRIVSANDAEWLDVSTGLAWARPWYYPPHAADQWNFGDAQAFCSTLTLAGSSDWRLPSADELQHVFLASASGWHAARPRFVEGYGLNVALSQGTWAPASFTVNGVKFQGNRLFFWTNTPGDQMGQHVGFYFGEPHSIDNGVKVGELQWGHMLNPFQGYALCVRAATP
jgi:hypothetical protein